jgi:hypothetical protein
MQISFASRSIFSILVDLYFQIMDSQHVKEITQNLEESYPEFQDVPDTPPERQPHLNGPSVHGRVMKTLPQNSWWYRPVHESINWSKNVIDFYYNGDAPFCYSGFLGNKELGHDFWGTLLGLHGYDRLSPIVRFYTYNSSK